jgi:hypothetical protein
MVEDEKNPAEFGESSGKWASRRFDPIFRVWLLASFSMGKTHILPRIDLDAWSTSLFGK